MSDKDIEVKMIKLDNLSTAENNISPANHNPENREPPASKPGVHSDKELQRIKSASEDVTFDVIARKTPYKAIITLAGSKRASSAFAIPV